MRLGGLALARDTLVYGLGLAASRAVSALLLLVIARVLEPREYGLVDLIATTVLLGSILLSLGLEGAVAYYTLTAQVKDQRDLFGTWLWCQVALAGVVWVAVLLTGPVLAQGLLGYPESAGYLLIGATTLSGALLYNLATNVLRYTFAARRYVAVTVLRVVVEAGLTVGLVVLAGWGLTGVLWGQCLGVVLAAVVALALTRRQYALTLSPHLLRTLVVFGLPLVPGSLGAWFLSAANRYLLAGLTTLDQVGLFAVAARIAAGVSLVIGGFQLAWAPHAYRLARRSDAPQVYARVLVIYLAGVSGVVLPLVLFAPEIVALASGSAYRGASTLVGPLAYATALYGAAYITGVGVYLVERPYFASLGVILAGLVNLGAGWVLIPPLGGLGAALAVLVGNGLAPLFLYGVSQRLYPIPYPLRPLLGLGAVHGGVLALVGLAALVGPTVSWALRLVALVLAGLVLWRLGSGAVWPMWRGHRRPPVSEPVVPATRG